MLLSTIYIAAATATYYIVYRHLLLDICVSSSQISLSKCLEDCRKGAVACMLPTIFRESPRKWKKDDTALEKHGNLRKSFIKLWKSLEETSKTLEILGKSMEIHAFRCGNLAVSGLRATKSRRETQSAVQRGLCTSVI